MATTLEPLEAHSPGGDRAGRAPAIGRALRRYTGVAGDWRTYAAILYLLLSFPLGIGWFVYLVTGLSLGAGLAITLVGIPLLVAVVQGARLAARFEARVANALLGARVQTTLGYEPDPAWRLAGIASRMKRGRTWLAVLFLLLRFPQGIATFVLTVTLLSVVGAAIAAPVIVPFAPMEWGSFWQLDTAWEGLVLAVPGLILMPLVLHILRLTGTGSARFTEALLGRERPMARPPLATAATPARPGPPVVAVDEPMRTVTVDGSPVELTPREFDLLALLSRTRGRPFSRQEILDRIWTNDLEVTDRTVDTHVQRLRKKLGRGGTALRTVWGIGYRLDP